MQLPVLALLAMIIGGAATALQGPTNARLASAVSAITPPSPWLSARSTNSTYLSDTTQINDQKISDSTPSTPSWLTCTP